VFWALLASLAAALATTALLAVHLTRSLRRLSIATAQLADGAFTHPLPVTSRDEIGELARSFNRMAERLREVDHLKEEFFSHISHELRTPLTSVKEATNLLLERVQGPLTAKQGRLVHIIAASSDRLLLLVNQVLDLSRLRARQLPLERRPVDMEKIVVRALEELRPQIEDKGLVVGCATSGSDFALQGDEDRLLRVVVNLVGNAIKFTPHGAAVTVGLTNSGPEVEIVVEDTGIGIPATDLPRIFDPYKQAHVGRGGSGLGLAIVKGLVEAHGGRIRVESEEGRGSRFLVRLPRDGAPSVGAAPTGSER
jgi:signal transduction histidine kinase